MVGTAVVVLDMRRYVATAGFYIPFAPTCDAAADSAMVAAFTHHLHTKNEYLQAFVLANIRPSAAAENGLSGTVTAPFQRQRSQKV